MKYIIKIDAFNEIVNGTKAMKADYICVYNDLLIGTDYTMSSIKTYRMNASIPLNPFTIIPKEFSSKFFANITDTDIVIDTDESKIYCPNNKTYADESNPMIDNSITNNIIDIYYRLMNTINQVYYIKSFGCIDSDPGFQKIRDLRAADGAILYEPNENISYGMYLYSGSIPVNKSDSTSLQIYDQGLTFISKFTVYKKKLNPVDIYFRFSKVK